MGERSLDQLSFGSFASMIMKKFRSALLVLLPLLFMSVFFYIPIAELIGRGLAGPEGFSLGKITSVISDPYLGHLISFTLEQALLSMALSILIGLFLAYVLSNFDFPGRRLIKTLTILPFALPPVIVALGFVLIYGRNGPLNQFLMGSFDLKEPPIQILYSLSGIVLAHAFFNAPIVARFVTATWERLPKIYEENALALGAPQWRVFSDVTLPMLLPGLISGATLAFVYSFLSFPVILAIGGAQLSTIEVEIYRRALIQIDYGGAAALAAIALGCSLLFTGLYIWAEQRFSRNLRIAGERARTPLFSGTSQDQRLKQLMLLICSLLLALFFIAPVAGVLADSVTRISGSETILTLDWYREVISPNYSSLIATSPIGSIWNSIKFALIAMGVSLIFGISLSVFLSRTRFRGQVVLEALAMAPIAASPIAFGLALLWATARPPFDLFTSGGAIVIAHSVLALPFVIRAVRPALSQFDTRLHEAARALGASQIRSLLDIVIPLLAGSLIAAASFAFAISIAETSATIMLAQPETTTMPLSVYYLLSSRQWGAASAMSVVMVAVVGVALFVMSRFGEQLLGRGRQF